MDYNIIQGVCTLTKSGNNYTGTLPIKYTSYKDKGIYICKANAGGVTDLFLNLNGIGLKPIYNWFGGDATLVADGWYMLMYVNENSGYFIALNHSVGV